MTAAGSWTAEVACSRAQVQQDLPVIIRLRNPERSSSNGADPLPVAGFRLGSPALSFHSPQNVLRIGVCVVAELKIASVPDCYAGLEPIRVALVPPTADDIFNQVLQKYMLTNR